MQLFQKRSHILETMIDIIQMLGSSTDGFEDVNESPLLNFFVSSDETQCKGILPRIWTSHYLSSPSNLRLSGEDQKHHSKILAAGQNESGSKRNARTNTHKLIAGPFANIVNAIPDSQLDRAQLNGRKVTEFPSGHPMPCLTAGCH
jgi:hypothetical protein